MKMKNVNLGVLGTATSWVCTALQTNEGFQNLMLILSVVSTIFTLIFTIFKVANVIIKWYNKARQDGKITKEEIEELSDNLAKLKKEENNNE